MLRINRVRIEISTQKGAFGFDCNFNKGLNFLSSEENTCGKSSIIAAIYYCLGLEEIIGGKGEKVLTSAFKTTIENDAGILNVLQSVAYLEITNGSDIITLFRSAKMQGRDSRMITVFYSNMDNISNPKTISTDTYVHFPNSAKNAKGFHHFLEKFLFLNLPNVTASDDTQKKLYLQLLFSSMFIEQKHGWSGLFSGMPYLGIKESKKRVIEFILKLDTLENDKNRETLKTIEAEIAKDWNIIYNNLQYASAKEQCSVINFPVKPKILNDKDIDRISILFDDMLLSEKILELKKQISDINSLKPKVVDNFDGLQVELKSIKEDILLYEEYISTYQKKLLAEQDHINRIKNNIETINFDLENNKDAARLRKLGSEMSISFSNDLCPICHQHINDSLLAGNIDIPIMNIDENIKHLEAQKQMLNFALLSHERNVVDLESEINNVELRLFNLRKLAQAIRNDLYTINEEYSETIIYKKITLKKQTESLEKLEKTFSDTITNLIKLSERWQDYLDAKKSLPTEKFSQLDKEKLSLLKNIFVDKLKSYGYKSIPNLNDITISEDSYLPLFEGFDMRFDSSASDNIRTIWAFTIALLQVSLIKDGNHPTLLILDEPDQQSTIISDMQSFFNSIIELSDNCQVIMGITLKDSDTKQALQSIPSKNYKQIKVSNKAFQLLD